MPRLRQPAFMPAPPSPAIPLADDPSALLECFYGKVWREQMQDLPFVNPELSVQAVGFRVVDGDWVGVMITPWFINVMLLPGGGKLWLDVASGEQRRVSFPVGELDFIADNNPDPAAPITAFQYCPLIHPVQHVADQASALAAAESALVVLFQPPPVPEEAAPENTETVSGESAPARRTFLRGLIGQCRGA